MAKDERAFLGRGWAFPIHLAEDGEIAMVEHEEDIRQALLVILQTNHGERAMRPELGANLQALAFEPLTTRTMALTKHRVETALVTWEPRIDSIQVQITATAALGRLDIEIRYRVRTTNTFYNLVYPFYVQEGRTVTGQEAAS